MATTVGLVHLDFSVAEAQSLKDKRRAVKSFKDRIASRTNVSIAEVDHLDNIRRGTLAVAVVGNDSRYLRGMLQRVVNAARANRMWVLLEYEIELI